MSLLVISGLTIRLGGRTLLDGADLTVDPGRRIGLVGRNGAGKSTLLRAIAGEISLDGGDIRLASRARLATVKQEAPEGPASLLDTAGAAGGSRDRRTEPPGRGARTADRHRCRLRPSPSRDHPGGAWL
jgi:ATP-binding cassette subfamily F protein 3